MDEYTFLKDLPVAAKLSPEFKDAFDRSIPEWLEALLPFYQESKRMGADLFETWPVLLLGDYFNDGKYEKDGRGYYYNDNGWARILSVESSPKYPSINLNWQYYVIDIHPEVDCYSIEGSYNLMYTNHYLTRYHNQTPPYDVVFNRVNALFQQMTGDPDVRISISHHSYLTLTPRGLEYVNYHHRID